MVFESFTQIFSLTHLWLHHAKIPTAPSEKDVGLSTSPPGSSGNKWAVGELMALSIPRRSNWLLKTSQVGHPAVSRCML